MPRRALRKFSGAAALLLAISIAANAWSAPNGDGPAITAASPAAAGKSANAAKPVPTAAFAAELRELKQTVEAQTQRFAEHSKELKSEKNAIDQELKQIAALEAKLGVSAPAAISPERPAATASFTSTAATRPAQAQTPEALSNRIANLEDRLKAFGRFTFSGDIRLRDEPSFGGPVNRSLDQNRERFRLRFNVDAELNEDFSGGFSLASGDINNPISDNQTIDDFYARKPISIDTAFVQYSPHQFHPLTLIGGKFAYPWYNTELVWDKDLRPEGAAETLAFNLKSAPVLKRIALVGFELPFTQVAGMSLNDESLVTSAVYGGQLQTAWQFRHWLKFGAFTGFYNYHNADPIALALAKTSASNPQTPLSGLLPLAGNTVQNSILTTRATSVVTIGGTAYTTGVTSISNAQFASKFGLFDSLATVDVATPWQQWPIKLVGDYVQNTEACANVPHLQPAPANTASVEYSQSLNYACKSHQRSAYWGEIQVGKTEKRGDWEFDYARMFIEREAVVSNFNYSEILQGSNVSEHRAEIIYEVHRNVQLSYSALIGRALNFGSTTPPAPWLYRMQFDVLYIF
jgi:Putative porin